MDQRRTALERANEIRSARARLKEQFKQMAPVEAFGAAIEETTNPHPDLHTMRVEEFLKAIPRVGKFHAGKLVNAAAAKGKLGSLTARQRAELSRQLALMRKRRYGVTTTEEATDGSRN